MENNSESAQIIPPLLPPEDGSVKRFFPQFRSSFKIKNTFAALSYRNYKLWFWGQMISLFGSWMQSTALAFFIYELTRSPAFLGYAGFASGIPAWVFSFYGGVAADRFPRRNILIITQVAMMLMAFLLAALTFTGVIEAWHILVFAFLSGIANAFDAPTRHAFVNELVEKKDLVNAIALNSTMFNTATAVGPALGGIAYALFGPAWCFTINGISFLAVLFNLKQMKLAPIQVKMNHNSIFSDLKEAVNYLKGNRTMVGILLVTATLSALGMGLVTLFPAWAVNILHGDSTTNGFLQSARGFGAVIFALTIATVNRLIERGKYLFYSVSILPLVLIIFSFNRSFPISIGLLIIIGGLIITQYNLSNGLIQTKVEEKFRGRILSFYTFTFFALYPLGSLWIGALAEYVSIPAAILANGIILLIFSFLIGHYFPSIKKEK